MDEQTLISGFGPLKRETALCVFDIAIDVGDLRI